MRPMPELEQVSPADLTELGDRAAFGMWGENTGLAWSQRLAAIVQRKPAGLSWRMHYDDPNSRMPTSMSWPCWDGRGMW